MMRNPIALLAVLLALVAGIYLLVKPESPEKSAEPSALYPELDTALVDAIVIDGRQKRSELVRTEDGWVVASEGDFPAEKTGVDRLLRELAHLDADEVVSRRAEKYDVFEVDSANGVGVTVSGSGETVASFVIGKRGPDMTSTYVRDRGRPGVFLQSSAIASFFDRGAGTWKEKQIFHLEMEDMRTLTVTRGDERLVFAQTDGEWNVVEPEGHRKVGSFLVAMARVLTRLTAIDFPPEEERAFANLDEPEARVEVALADGTSRVLLIGPEREDAPGRIVKRGSDDVLYSVQASRLANFLRPAEELVEPAPPAEADTTDAAAEEG